MRLVIQNVTKASLSIENNIYSSIEEGFLVLVGYEESDNLDLAKKMVDKMLKLRVFQDSSGKTNLSLKDIAGNILFVSQFTLYASCKDGNRPSFTYCMKPDAAKKLYQETSEYLSTLLPQAKFGVFGADMDISLINKGPFTIILDSKELYER